MKNQIIVKLHNNTEEHIANYMFSILRPETGLDYIHKVKHKRFLGLKH